MYFVKLKKYLSLPLSFTLAFLLFFASFQGLAALPRSNPYSQNTDNLLIYPQIKFNGSTQILLAKNFYFRTPVEKVFQTKYYKIFLYAKSFSQADLFYLIIVPNHSKLVLFYRKPVIYYQGKKIPLSKSILGYHGFFGVPPDGKLGYHHLNAKVWINTILKDPHIHQEKHSFWINKTYFTTSHNKLYINKGSSKKKRRGLSARRRRQIRMFAREKRRAFKTVSKKIYIKASLAHPTHKHFVTSPFWATRHIARFKYKNGKSFEVAPRVRIHKGLDLRARKGTPIYAIADARVLISKRMHYEGNFVLLDHGHGLLSGYMHLNRRLVRRGQRVKAGVQLGTGGATGAVTGAHLHLLLYIRRVHVSPLSLLSLPVQ